jgi:hypothetical protein
MKYSLLFLFIFCSIRTASAQSSVLSRFSVSFEQKMKLDKSTTKVNGPNSYSFTENEHLTKVYHWLLGYTFSKNWTVQVGYGKESFVNGFSIGTNNGFIFESPTNYLITHVIPIRFRYDGLSISYQNMQFAIEPSIGAIGHFRIDDGDIGGNGIGTFTATGFSLIERYNRGEEFDLTSSFIRLETQVQARIKFYNIFSIYGGIGYCRGTEAIGRVNLEYMYLPDPTVHRVKKTNYGNSPYYHFGLSLHLNSILKKKPLASIRRMGSSIELAPNQISDHQQK